MTCEELENEIFISVIRDFLFFLFVNCARNPPCTTLLAGQYNNIHVLENLAWASHYADLTKAQRTIGVPGFVKDIPSKGREGAKHIAQLNSEQTIEREM